MFGEFEIDVINVDIIVARDPFLLLLTSYINIFYAENFGYFL